MSRIYVVEPGASGGIGVMGMKILVQALRNAGHDARRVRLHRKIREPVQTSLWAEAEDVSDAAILPRPDAWFVSVLYVRQYVELAAMFAAMGVAPLTRDRLPSDPLVAFGGQFSIAPAPLADLADVIALGDGEITGVRIAEMLDAGATRADVMRDLDGERGFWVPSRSDGPLLRAERESYDLIEIHSDSRTTIELARGCASKCAFCRIGWAGGKYREAPPEQVKAALQRNAGRAVNVFAPDFSSVSWVDGALDAIQAAGCRNTGVDARADATHRLLKRGDGVKNYAFGVEGLSERLRAAVGKPLSRDRLISVMRELGEGGVRFVRWYMILGLPGEDDRDVAEFCDLVSDVRREYSGAIGFTCTLFAATPHTPLERDSGEWPEPAVRRRDAIVEHLIGLQAADGRRWIANSPKGRELHEYDVSAMRASRASGERLATARPADVQSGRWREYVDGEIGPVPWGAKTPWAHVEGPAVDTLRSARDRYARTLRRWSLRSVDFSREGG